MRRPTESVNDVMPIAVEAAFSFVATVVLKAACAAVVNWAAVTPLRPTEELA